MRNTAAKDTLTINMTFKSLQVMLNSNKSIIPNLQEYPSWVHHSLDTSEAYKLKHLCKFALSNLFY